MWNYTHLGSYVIHVFPTTILCSLSLRILFTVITCSLHNNSLNESFKDKRLFGRRRRSETQIKFGYINVVEKVYLQTTEDFSQT